jgi:DNA transposition AAA+ family ATPase
MSQATEIAEQLGQIEQENPSLQKEIERLHRKNIVELEQVVLVHNWLESKRKSGQPCRIVGESRTGKTIACDSYRLRHQPIQEYGKPPTVPVIYIQPPIECGSRELFGTIIEDLRYQIPKGTIADLRDRTYKVLKGCNVEMLIIDEADRLKPKTFADVRDFYDKLNISVVLVGTDRLDALIKRDEQVYNRFRACYQFKLLTGEQLRQTVEIWERQVLCLPVASNLTSNEMLNILQKATRGYIGLLDMVLRTAAIRSLQKGLTRIDKATLQEVTEEFR